MVWKRTVTESEEFAESIINTVREPLIALDQDLRVVKVSRSFYDFFKVKPEETMGQLIYDLGNHQWDIPKLRELLETILPQQTSFDNYEVELDFDAIGRRTFLLNARRIARPIGKEGTILLAIEDATERKRLENLLSDYEERYRRLFETAVDGIVLLEKGEGKITHANPATEKMLGYSREESIGNRLQDIGISLDLGHFQTTMERLSKIGIIKHDDVPAKTKAGQHIDTDIYLVDRARLVQCNIRDITERKKADAVIRLQAAIIENSPVIAAYHDKDLNMVWANRAYRKATGLSLEEVRGRKCYQIWNLSKPCLGCPVITAIETGESAAHELTPDNQDHWPETQGCWLSQAVPVRDEQGAVIGALEFAIDITERKQAEEALKEANRKLQASQKATLNMLEELKAENQVRKAKEAELDRVMMAIEQAGEVIMITDPAGTIQYVNPAFETVTGYAREEAVGKTPGILKSGRQDQTFYQNLWETITSGRIWQGRMVNQRKDGTLYTEDATISPVFDAAGKIINYVGVKRDVTAHLELTAQLQQAQKMESVGRLAGGVAHDFNNKLTVMLGYTQMVMESLGKGDPKYGDLQEVMNAGQQSVAIVRQLLAFARKQIIAPEVLELNETVQDMVKMLRRLIGEDIALVWSPGHDLWQVKMDPSQLDQILANLCVNARDAISRVGKVTIETRNVVLDAHYCADHAGFVPGDYVMLGVSDNGCGMDKETLANAFEPFFTTKEVSKGTGLGLSTVYGIVKQNDGFVNIYSEPGKGTTFKMYLPRYSEEPEEKSEVVPTEIPLGHGETILVVEDEASVLGLARRILEKLGYAVLTSASPAEAVNLVRGYAGEIHLIMTDVVLPGMNGRDLAGEISKIRPNIKTMFMSGYTAEIIARQGVLDKGVHFIEKPFTFESLARKVRKAMGTRNAEVGTRR